MNSWRALLKMIVTKEVDTSLTGITRGFWVVSTKWWVADLAATNTQLTGSPPSPVMNWFLRKIKLRLVLKTTSPEIVLISFWTTERKLVWYQRSCIISSLWLAPRTVRFSPILTPFWFYYTITCKAAFNFTSRFFYFYFYIFRGRSLTYFPFYHQSKFIEEM